MCRNLAEPGDAGRFEGNLGVEAENTTTSTSRKPAIPSDWTAPALSAAPRDGRAVLIKGAEASRSGMADFWISVVT